MTRKPLHATADPVAECPPEAPMSEARAKFEAEMYEFDAMMLRKAEWAHIDRKLTDLYQRRHAGDDTVLTRQRIERLEALQSCLCGSPEALANGAPPVRPMRA